MMKLIVNADDFGYAAERDAGIMDGFQGGIITSASLLVNGMSSTSAVKLYRRSINNDGTQRDTSIGDDSKQDNPRQIISSRLGLGLHFNMTEGQSLVDGSTFLGKFGFWDACAHIDTSVSSSSSSSSPPPHEHGSTSRIKQELRAQLDWFVEHVGHNPTHVDGHNHIHVIPQVVQAMAEVLPTYNITWVRMPCEDLSDYQWPSAKSQMFYDRVVGEAERAKAVFTEAGIGYSDHFIGLRLMGKAASLLALENVLDSINTTNASNVDERSHDEKSATAIQGNGAESCEADRSTEKKGEAPSAPSSSSSSPSLSPSSSPSPRVQSVEYMCHPGYASEKGDDFSRSKDREHELALLTSTRAHACIIERNIALSSFADL